MAFDNDICHANSLEEKRPRTTSQMDDIFIHGPVLKVGQKVKQTFKKRLKQKYTLENYEKKTFISCSNKKFLLFYRTEFSLLVQKTLIFQPRNVKVLHLLSACLEIDLIFRLLRF